MNCKTCSKSIFCSKEKQIDVQRNDEFCASYEWFDEEDA